ncbi:MAG: flavin reductase family protein [Flavobacteriaceae bacterium]
MNKQIKVVSAKNERHQFLEEDLLGLDKIYRLNLINSCTGYKSANLIGTQSKKGQTNLAVFSSITHLGSNPALLGFILRPTTVPRHTHNNLKETGFFSVNSIVMDQIEEAHHTSAKYPENHSEFDQTHLEPEYISPWEIPFVKGAPIQIVCQYQNEYHIKENDTILVVGKIKGLYVAKTLLLDDGWIQLDKGNIAAINGLDGYAEPNLRDRFPYARPKQ